MKRFTIIISFIMLTFMPLMAQVKQTVAVLGDSYSTFEGFIPKGYATWYSPTTPPETTDVNKVEQTWWWQVIKEGGYKMGNINSYLVLPSATLAIVTKIIPTVHSSPEVLFLAIRISS